MQTAPSPASTNPSGATHTPAPPSIHTRAVITWLAIFPLVAIGMMVSAPLMEGWHPVLRALGLTLVVVPTAVYLVVPRMMKAHAALVRRRPRA